MSYHNIRGANGRFIKKQDKPKAVKKTSKKQTKKKDKKGGQILNLFLLDYSVSMLTEGKAEAVIKGFNKIMETNEQTAISTGVKNTDIVSVFGNKNSFAIKSGITRLNENNYNPRQGSTALLEAVFKALSYLEKTVKSYPEDTRVMLTILTDGEENSSPDEYKKSTPEYIQRMREKGWVINFMGAGEKIMVEKAAESMNIAVSNTMSFSDDSEGIFDTVSAYNNSRTAYSKSVALGTDSNVGFFSND